MYVCFCCVCFSFSVLSQEIGWEERLRNDLFCVGWKTKTLSQLSQLDGGPDPPSGNGNFGGCSTGNASSR